MKKSKIKPIKVLLVDDEELAREGFKMLLEDFEEFEVVGEAENGFEAVKAINSLNPDLVFLDIEMPKLDGFDVVSLLGDNPPYVVFVTAYDQYAIKAFEVRALDYLMKPVSTARLQKTLDEIKLKIKSNNQPEKIRELVTSHEENSSINRVVVKDGSNVYIIPLEEIMYIKAEDDYVSIYTNDGKSYLKHSTLTNMDKILPSNDFCRIHRSIMINIFYLKKIEPYTKDSKIAILKDGTELSISRSGYTVLSELL